MKPTGGDVPRIASIGRGNTRKGIGCGRQGERRLEKSGSAVRQRPGRAGRIGARNRGAGRRRTAGGCAVRHVRHRRRHGDRARARLAGAISTQRGRHVHAGDRADLHFRRHFVRDRRARRLARRSSAVLRHVHWRTDRQLAAVTAAGTGAAVDFRGVSRVRGDQSGEFCAVARPPDRHERW